MTEGPEVEETEAQLAAQDDLEIEVETPDKEYNPQTFTIEKQAEFLRHFMVSCNQAHAAREAGIPVTTVEYAKENSEYFAKMYEQAEKKAVGELEAEAMRRAKDGYTQPVYQDGEKVGEKRYYDSKLAKFLLKAHNPEKFANNKESEMDISISWEGPAPGE